MKNATAYANTLAAHVADLRTRYTVEEAAPMSPTARLVHAFLSYNAPLGEADAAYGRIMEQMVDFNELRVTTENELLELIGEDSPAARERVARMHDALHEVYERERCTSIDRLADAPKREARSWLQSLPGMAPYVEASVSLLSLAAHAFPVDDRLLEGLKSAEVVAPDATVADATSFVERNVKAEEAVETHLLLRAWLDDQAPAPAASAESGKEGEHG